MKKLFLSIFFFLLAVIFCILASFSERLIVGIIYITMVVLALFLCGYIYFEMEE